jgi:hypothetical protein
VPASGDSEDDCGEQMECRLAGETEVIGENLPQRHFCPSQNPTCLGEAVFILFLTRLIFKINRKGIKLSGNKRNIYFPPHSPYAHIMAYFSAREHKFL